MFFALKVSRIIPWNFQVVLMIFHCEQAVLMRAVTLKTSNQTPTLNETTKNCYETKICKRFLSCCCKTFPNTMFSNHFQYVVTKDFQLWCTRKHILQLRVSKLLPSALVINCFQTFGLPTVSKHPVYKQFSQNLFPNHFQTLVWKSIPVGNGAQTSVWKWFGNCF